jgi:hypothetical protein
MSYIDDLKDIIHNLHGAEATHRESVPITEVFNGETVWDGIVEVFTLHGHSKTDTAYAWSHDTDDPENPKHHVTVLHLGPVTSAAAAAAVRAAIIQEYRSNAETA